MSTLPPLLRIDRHGQSFVFDLRSGDAVPTWLGPALDPAEAIDDLAASAQRGAHESQPEISPPCGLLPQDGWGYAGAPGVILLRQGQKIETRFRLSGVGGADDRLCFIYADDLSQAKLDLEWSFSASGVVRARSLLHNAGEAPLTVAQLASLSLPLPKALERLVRWSGRWAGEMQEETVAIANLRGAVGIRSVGGRPGFEGAHWALFEEADDPDGLAFAAHLAWSGDGHWSVEREPDGAAIFMMGSALDCGEITLAPGAVFEAPEVHWWIGAGGREAARTAFHKHLRHNILPASADITRKVHLNSWEALGFSLDHPELDRLVDHAAAIGVERFVLDDGWFVGRRDDTTSLGDWTPDPLLFPDGLGPLIARVRGHGMDFGLWVEPEMVSPHSRLYRDHPDWCLHLPGAPRPVQRQQLVLNLCLPDVSEYLFGSIDKLLSENAISYLKWDHNRPLFPRTGLGHAQVVALYRLLDRVRATHPDVEIESCASGGGRVDLEILKRCTRIWASDNNDAIERLRINRSWFQFLPPEIVGNHVGPSPNPVTGRRLSIDFRAKVALFGHMGIEADPGRMTTGEREALSAHVALYKAWRPVIHGGTLSKVSCGHDSVFGWLSLAGPQGLALVAQTAFSPAFDVPPVRFPGLCSERVYRVRLLEPWPSRGAARLPEQERWRQGLRLSGRALAMQGLALPLALPETAWLIGFEEEE
jgi:alpha-galactosidase